HADVLAIEDVGLEIDVVARGRHGGEHRLVGARPVDQHAGGVARDERQRRGRLGLDGRRRAAGYGQREKRCRYLTRMSFLTERTPSTFLAASAARVAWSCESTKPDSCTVPL